MKLKKYFILVSIVLILLIFNLGLYQSKYIKVGDMIISKPFGYRFQSMPTTDNISFIELQKSLLGLNTTFKLDENIITLVFNKLYLNNKIVLQILSFKNEKEIFMLKYNENIEQLINEENCIYKINEEFENSDKLYTIHGLLKKMNVSFNIRGNNNSDILQLKENICNYNEPLKSNQ